MFKIFNKYKYILLIITLCLIFTLIYKYDIEVIQDEDLSLITISMQLDNISNEKIIDIINNISSLDDFVANVYYKDAIHYRRKVYLKTLDDYDFNLWKRIYSDQNISSFIISIANVLERGYISRYDDASINLDHLHSLLKRIYFFLKLQNEFLSGKDVNSNDIVNSILFDNEIHDIISNSSLLYVQLKSLNRESVNQFSHHLEDILIRINKNMGFDISMPGKANSKIKLYYKEFDNLIDYYEFYKVLSSSNQTSKIYNFLDYYNEQDIPIRYQFINRLKQINIKNEDVFSQYINALEVLEEKVFEIQQRYPNNKNIFNLTSLIIGDKANISGTLNELIDNFILSDTAIQLFDNLNNKYLIGMNKLISDSHSMAHLNKDILPNEIYQFYLNQGRYILRYY